MELTQNNLQAQFGASNVHLSLGFINSKIIVQSLPQIVNLRKLG